MDILKNFFSGYCLKTWTTDDQKVFVNVCHSKEIKPPEDISDKEMEKIWSDESYNFIIPIAIGQEKLATDNGTHFLDT